jgi:pimeloyl-ACP methyl ester carboxylesterase
MHEEFGGVLRGGTAVSGAGRLSWRTLGRGDLVIDLVTGAAPDRFHEVLARRFQVASFEAAGVGAADTGELRTLLAEVSAATGHKHFSLVFRGAALPLVLNALRGCHDLIEALVLIAPPRAAEAGAIDGLSAVAQRSLVLSGTRGVDSPPEAGSRFRARVPGCHYVLVYDAGDAIEIDRPEATASVVGDFLSRREHFIVAHASGLIHP